MATTRKKSILDLDIPPPLPSASAHVYDDNALVCSCMCMSLRRTAASHVASRRQKVDGRTHDRRTSAREGHHEHKRALQASCDAARLVVIVRDARDIADDRAFLLAHAAVNSAGRVFARVLGIQRPEGLVQSRHRGQRHRRRVQQQHLLHDAQTRQSTKSGGRRRTACAAALRV